MNKKIEKSVLFTFSALLLIFFLVYVFTYLALYIEGEYTALKLFPIKISHAIVYLFISIFLSKIYSK